MGRVKKKRVNYYPFGLQQKRPNIPVNGRSHQYKYNNTELEEGLGLNWYEMPLRSFDPTIARWNRVDPVTHYGLSTYNTFANNPIYYNDPSGGSHSTIVEGRWTNNRDLRQDPNAGANFGTTWGNWGFNSYTNPNNTDSNGYSAVSYGTDLVAALEDFGVSYTVLSVGDIVDGDPTNPYKLWFDQKAVQYEDFGNGGAMGTYNGAVRVGYALTTFNLKSLYNSPNHSDWRLGNQKRYNYKLRARSLTSPVWRRLLNLSHPVSLMTIPDGATRPPTRFFKTNLGWNMAGGVSLATGVFGLGVSGYNIYNAENRLQQTAIEGGSWAGAWLGAELGGTIAASHFPHPVYIGAWSIGGGIFGGIYGRDVMERAIENSENVNFSGLDNSMRNCNGNVCFGKGTEVVLGVNEFRNIEDIKEGDFILNYDIDKNIFIKDKVLSVNTNKVSQYIILSLKNGVKIKVTYNHYILTRDNGYVMSHNIKKGDFLAREKNGKLKFIEVNEIKNSEDVLEVYNLKTSKKNFLVTKNGIIVLDSSSNNALSKSSK